MTGPDGIRGASPIGLCREAMGLAVADRRVVGAVGERRGAEGRAVGPGGDDGRGLDRDAVGGMDGAPPGTARRSGRIAVVSGDVTFSPVTMPLADAQFVETRRLSTAEIARIFRVPTSVIGASSGDSLTYKTTEGEAQTFVTFGLGPWLKLIEDAITADRDLLPGETGGCAFNMDAAAARRPRDPRAVYTQALATGWLTVDEVRAREGLPPLPEGAARRSRRRCSSRLR